MEGKSLPERFERIAGPLPDPGTLAPEARGPYESISPAREGFLDNDGVKIWGTSAQPGVFRLTACRKC